MTIAGLLLLASAAAAGPAADPASAEIVVQAVRGKCRIAYAGSLLDGHGLQRLADGWPADQPLRVVEPRGANRKCLTRIALELAGKGFNHLIFIDPPSPDVLAH
jgi:hypothetical protein